MMGAKIQRDSANVFHLVTLYNAYAGTNLNSTTVKQPANYPGFVKWMFGFIKTLSQRMTERTVKYHLNIGNDVIHRHTPIRDQRIFLYSPELNSIDAQVLSDVYNDEFLRFADHESVNFWQSFNSPDRIVVTPNYIDNTGAVVNSETETDQSNIMGIIFDREAMGLTEIFESMDNSPYNARGKYYNVFYHWNVRFWNDLTENAAVLLLD